MNLFKYLCILFVCCYLQSCRNKDSETTHFVKKDLSNQIGEVSENEWTPVNGYNYGEKVIKLNGLSLERTSKNHMNLIKELGLKPDSIVERGEEHFDEFGYRFYDVYYHKDILELSGNYNIESDEFFVFGFSISGKQLNVNGIVLGDSIEKVKQEFPKFVEDEEAVSVFLGDQAVSFFHKTE